MSGLDHTNINSLWAHLIMEELYRNGVRCVGMASGSRSSPLTIAAAQHPGMECVVHYDERGAAFYALGWGRATGHSAVWLTTSGTAVTNGLPAVIEADMDRVPLLLITADRPPELRDTGANQTIDQVNIYGSHVRRHFDMPCPTREIDPAMVLTTIDQACYRTTFPVKGPVHINCMLREPLALENDAHDYADYISGLKRWLEDRKPYTVYSALHGRDDADHKGIMEEIASLISSVKQGLVVAGKLDTEQEREGVLGLAEEWGWPVCPDITSGLRNRRGESFLIPYYDRMLAHEDLAEAFRPEAVLHIGGACVSQRLTSFIERNHPPVYIVVNDHPRRQDPLHRVTMRVDTDIAGFCSALARAAKGGGDPEWLSRWQTCSLTVHNAIEEYFSTSSELSEPVIAKTISDLLLPGHNLVLASSMPIRDMDMFSGLMNGGSSVAANRGASGIDGTIATAAGYNAGNQCPGTLIIGDLACLHDLNSWAYLTRARYPVVMVIINNDGGGVFSFLPVAEHTEPELFERYFGTPHGLTFKGAAQMFGLPYDRPASRRAFIKAYKRALASTGSSVIEVVSDRGKNYELHKCLEDCVRGAMDQADILQLRG